MRYLPLLFLLLLPVKAFAEADMIMGVDSTTGVPEVLTPEDAGALIGATGGLDAQFDAENEIDGATAATPFLVGSGDGRWSLYRDATLGLQFLCVIAGVENDCNYIRKLASGKYFEIQDHNGTSIFRVSAASGAITNARLDAEGTGNAITLPFRWDLDMCGVSPTDGTTVGHVWNRDPLSTAPTATADVDTNRGRCVLAFPDSDGDYGVQITRQIPDGILTGNLDADIWWDTAGTGNARFQIQTKCYADDEADDASFNTASVVTATAGTSGRPNKQTITGITTTGCAGGEMMRIRFFRNRTEASDSLNAALNVEKVVFKGRVIE